LGAVAKAAAPFGYLAADALRMNLRISATAT
jgi:hypothetical protein